MQLKPTSLSKEQVKKVLKTVLWIAGSGAVTAVIAYVTERQEDFGIMWPLVNALLVLLKQVFTPAEA